MKLIFALFDSLNRNALTCYGGTRRAALTQTIDIMPTLLDMFDVKVPAEVRGHSLMPLMARDGAVREIGHYGMFGAPTNATDGRYTYFRYPDDIASQELYEYTLMPTHMRDFFQADEIEGAALAEPFDFTKGMPTLRIPAHPEAVRPGSSDSIHDAESVLYDLESDSESTIRSISVPCPKSWSGCSPESSPRCRPTTRRRRPSTGLTSLDDEAPSLESEIILQKLSPPLNISSA